MKHTALSMVCIFFLASGILFFSGTVNVYASSQSVIPLSGTVSDMSTSQPIASATVSTNTGSEVQTDPQGYYEFDSLLSGVYDITFSKTGYQSVTHETVIVYPSQSNVLDVLLTTPGELNIETTELPDASTGVEYNERVRISGGTWPYTFSVAAGTLPGGLTLDTEYGNISGTPTVPGSSSFTIGITDLQNAYASRQFTLTVTEPLSIVSDANLPEAVMDQTYAYSFEASGGTRPYTFSASDDLPLDLYLTPEGQLTRTVSNTQSFDTQNLHQRWQLTGNTSLKNNTLYLDGTTRVSSAGITVNCVAGTLSFTRAARNGGINDSEYRFYIDGSLQESLNYGSSGEDRFSVSISQGTHTFEWELETNAGDTGNGYYAWIDNLYIPQDLSGELYFTVTVTDSEGDTAEKQFFLPVEEALSITADQLPNGITGETYNHTLNASGGYGSHTWDIFSGTLPEGLTLDEGSGTLSGVPVEETCTTLVFCVTDEADHTVYQDFTLRIAAPLEILTTTMPHGLTGNEYSEIIRTSGGISPFSYSYSGQLPPGLSLDSDTGIISGTPDTGGTTNLTVSVTDSAWPDPQEVSQSLSITVSSDLTITTPAVLTSQQIGQTISSLVLTAGGGPSPYTWDVISGFLPDGISLDTGQGQLSGELLDQGDFIFTIQVTDSNGNTAEKEFFWHIASDLVITTQAMAAGAIDQVYQFTLEAQGGTLPYTWRMTSGTLPGGLSFDESTGTVSGTPTTRQTWSFTVEVSDSDAPAQTATQTYLIDISDELAVLTASLPNGRIDTAYTAELQAALGVPPYTWQLESGALPTGLELTATSETATIQGIPTTQGDVEFTIQVSDTGIPVNTVSKTYQVSIYETLMFSTTSLDTAVRGESYSAYITLSGGAPSLQWQISQGELPAGLCLNSTTGQISGTPRSDTSQSEVFTITVTDGGNPSQSIDREFKIFVVYPLEITTEIVLDTFQYMAYQARLSGQGGVSPYTWQVSQGILPSGMVLDSESGLISGTPSWHGTFSFQVRLTDSADPANTIAKNFLLNVMESDEPPAIDPDRFDAVLVLTGNVGYTLPRGSNTEVYGTSTENRITLESGANATLLSFPGPNIITIASDTTMFTGSRSGATVILEGSDGTWISLPATTSVQTIVFEDGALDLVIKDGQVILGGLVIGMTPQSLGAAVFTPVESSEELFTGDLEDPDACLILNGDMAYTLGPSTSTQVYGTGDGNAIVLADGAKARLISFAGNNRITLESDFSGFTVSRSGTTVTLEGQDGTLLEIPATLDIQSLVFDDRTVDLVILDGEVLLGDDTVPEQY